MKSKHRELQIGVAAITLLGLVTSFQACSSKFDIPDGQVGVYENGSGGMLPVVATGPAKVTDSEKLLPSLVSVVGVGRPSSRTLTAYRNERARVSETGDAESVNAPMWLAVTNVAGEVCWDLIAQEKPIPAAQRRIFSLIDFTKGPKEIADAATSDVVRRLARSAWARNETDEERTLIASAVKASFGSSAAAAETDRAMLFTCTSVLAAMDTHVR